MAVSTSAIPMAVSQPEHYFASMHYNNGTPLESTPSGSVSDANASESIAPTPGSLAGRKRSRGDIHAPEEDEVLEDGSVNVPEQPPEVEVAEPIYGPGMTIIHPNDPYSTLANASQSGTWVEERDEQIRVAETRQARPSISTRKSQRINGSVGGSDDLAQLVLPHSMREVTAEPLIDEATRVLGISWTRMDSSEALRINQAAYSKWIRNHYPGLRSVTVWFENSAIPGYLVAATNAYSGQQEYYIFSNDLTEARLITSDPTQLVPRLQMLPALELAAPGGCIAAQLDSVPNTQNDTQVAPSEPEDVCTAQSMEID